MQSTPLEMPLEFQIELEKWQRAIASTDDLEGMKAIALSAIEMVYTTKAMARQLKL